MYYIRGCYAVLKNNSTFSCFSQKLVIALAENYNFTRRWKKIELITYQDGVA